jgi:hypothetical protein
VPLIKEIDEQYKELCPTEHADQLEKISAIKGLLVRGLVLPTSLYLKT